MGGTPLPPLNGKSPKIFAKKMGQKGLKMHEKKAKNRVFAPKKPALSGIFLSGVGGYSPPPLTDNHCAQKSLAERGGTPPPLTDKIR